MSHNQSENENPGGGDPIADAMAEASGGGDAPAADSGGGGGGEVQQASSGMRGGKGRKIQKPKEPLVRARCNTYPIKDGDGAKPLPAHLFLSSSCDVIYKTLTVQLYTTERLKPAMEVKITSGISPNVSIVGQIIKCQDMQFSNRVLPTQKNFRYSVEIMIIQSDFQDHSVIEKFIKDLQSTYFPTASRKAA